MRDTWLLGLIGCASVTTTPSVKEVTPASPAPQAEPEVIAEPNRAFTAGEVALLRPVFRDGIDYEHARVINNALPLQPQNVYMTPRGHVYAPGGLWEPDFSTAGVGRRSVFVHEVMHIWQHTNGMDLIQQGFIELTKAMGDYEKAYAYELVAGRDLVDYGMEQQASIVEDYFTITVDHQQPHRITNKALGDKERDALYAQVLAKFLANARYAQSLDARRIADQHGQAAELQQPGAAACKESEQEHGASHMCEWRYQPLKK